MGKNLFQTSKVRFVFFGIGLIVAPLVPGYDGCAQSQTQVCYTYSASMGHCSINELIPSTELDSLTTCLLEAGYITVDACETRAKKHATQIGAALPTTPCPEWVQDTYPISSCLSPSS